MRIVRWFYHRIGQILCFGGAALLLIPLASDDEHGDAGWQMVVIVGFLAVVGVGLKALDIWQRMNDPGRE